MNFIQALMCGLLYYFSDSPWPFGEGYYVFQRPLVSGFLMGLVMGKPVEGTIIGATMNLIYLGHITAGGTMPGDMALAGYLGTGLALAANLDVNAALSLAVPLGLLGTIVWFTRMSVDSVFCHWADRYAEAGDCQKVWLMNWLPAQALLFVIKVPIVTLAAFYGPNVVSGLLAMVGDTFIHGLSVAGGMLPALGIALNLRSILKKQIIPYFVLGFILVVYFKLDIIGVSLVGTIIAVLANDFFSQKGGAING